jgi:hypothetical protein
VSDKYDRNGRPISLQEWSRLFEDKTYQIILQERTVTGAWVSTVWLGLNHNFLDDGPPLIFETMVFLERGNRRDELACRRYATEDEARQGHADIVARFGGVLEVLQ